MLFRHFSVLVAALVASLARAAASFPSQEILSDFDPDAPQSDPIIINIEAETAECRQAEAAVAEFSVTGSGPSFDFATLIGTELADDFEHILTEVSKRDTSQIDTWTRSEGQVKPRVHSIPQAYAYSDFGLRLHESVTTFTVQLNELIMKSSDIVRMLTSSHGVVLERTEWKLSDESYQELKEAVNAKGYFILQAEAERYAETLGKSTAQPTECAWDYSEIRWEVEGEDADLPRPQLKLGVTSKCRFELS